MTNIYMAGCKVFFDTGAFIALSFKKDCNHEPAAKILKSIVNKGVRQVTTNLIVAETYTFLRYNVNYATAVSFLNIQKSAESAGKLEVIYATAGIEIDAAKLLQKYHDQDLSYADAVSLAILARNTEIKDVFAFDGHFYLSGRNIIPASY